MSRSKVKGQGHQGQNRKKTAASSPLRMHCKAWVVFCKWCQSATDRTIPSQSGGDGSARWRRLACGVCMVKYL